MYHKHKKTSLLILMGILLTAFILSGCAESDYEEDFAADSEQNALQDEEILTKAGSNLIPDSQSMTILKSIVLRNGVSLRNQIGLWAIVSLLDDSMISDVHGLYLSCQLFEYKNLGDNYILLKSFITNNYVCADLGRDPSLAPLYADRPDPSTWERFQISQNSGYYQLRSYITNKYVWPTPGGLQIYACAGKDDTAAKWTIKMEPFQARVALFSYVSYSVDSPRYVSASPGSQLKADSKTIEKWKNIFDLIWLGNNQIRLRSWKCGGYYVCTDYNKNHSVEEPPLYANREDPDKWETYDMIDLGNNKIALRSCFNNRYVSADLDHGNDAPLYANSDQIGDYETFVVIQQDK